MEVGWGFLYLFIEVGENIECGSWNRKKLDEKIFSLDCLVGKVLKLSSRNDEKKRYIWWNV